MDLGFLEREGPAERKISIHTEIPKQQNILTKVYAALHPLLLLDTPADRFHQITVRLSNARLIRYQYQTQDATPGTQYSLTHRV